MSSLLLSNGTRPVPSPACAKCGSTGVSVGGWIKTIVSAVCKDSAQNGRRCAQRCSDYVKPKVPVDLECISKWCGADTVIQCTDCPNEGTIACPGCPGKTVSIPGACGYTYCNAPLDPVKNSVTICCNATGAELSHKCNSRQNIFPRVCEPPITLLHELAHVCGSGRGCNNDDSFPKIDDWAYCMYSCLFGGGKR
jgi:hypothetical protein